jgi:hypothetical protein
LKYIDSNRKSLGYLFDQISRTLNTLIGPLLNKLTKTKNFGYYKNTLSSSLGKTWPDCKYCQWFCKVISIIGSDDKHCREASAHWKKED